MPSILPSGLQPLSRRLPLMLAVVLLAVVGSIVWIAANRLSRSVKSEEKARLLASAQRISANLNRATRRVSREGEGLATIPELHSVGTGRNDGQSIASATRALDAELKRNPQTVAIGIWSGRRLVAFVGPAGYVVADTPQLFRRDGASATRAPRLGPLQRVGDTVTYAVSVPVMGPDSTGPPVGAIVAVRRLASGANAATYGELIGRGARLRLGNADGTLWSDFARTVHGPTMGFSAEGGVEFDEPGRGRQIAAVAPVAGAPWVVMITTDETSATEPVRQFLAEAGWIAALLIAVGLTLTWFSVRRSLQPLRAVIAAAEGIAAGDFGRRAPVSGGDETGRLAASFNTMVDRVALARSEIEDRAKALETANVEIRESEARYHGLVDHSPDGILIHRGGQISYANPAAAALLGVDADALIGRSVFEFLPRSEHALVRDRNRSVEAGETVAPVEVPLVRPDMKSVIVECTGIPILVDGMPAVQAILHDVSERRQLEEQVQQSQKMEAVGRLAGGIAHDFNNLLTIIDSYSEFASHGLESGDPRREDIGEVRRAAATAAQLTRQLLAFSRKQGRTPQAIRLNDAIKGMVGMLQRLIGDDVRLSTVLRPEVPGIWGDPNQLQQILLNLAVNARDAMPSGGELRIETSSVTIAGVTGAHVATGTLDPGTYAMLLVQDTGVGMAPEVRARIFEPFFTTKQAGRGTGLGLSTVYGIVTQSHGHIGVESGPGQGTTFKIYLPAFDEAHAAPVEKRAEPRSRAAATLRILLVEDEPSVRQAICRMLSRDRGVVIEAGDATEALAILDRHPEVDLVVTDLMMPGMPGTELIAAIKRRWPHLPVILMSGYVDEGSGKRIPDGVTFIEKPIAPAELLSVVHRVMQV